MSKARKGISFVKYDSWRMESLVLLTFEFHVPEPGWRSVINGSLLSTDFRFKEDLLPLAQFSYHGWERLGRGDLHFKTGCGYK